MQITLERSKHNLISLSFLWTLVLAEYLWSYARKFGLNFGILQLLEERRRHGEFAEKLEQSKIEAQRLQADYSRSETQRTQLQNELSKVQATR